MATFTMTAFTKKRSIEIYRSKACFRASEWVKENFRYDIFLTPHDNSSPANTTVIYEDIGQAGNGGGDYGLMKALHYHIKNGGGDHDANLIEHSFESHKMAFAIHESGLRAGDPLLYKGHPA